MSKQSTKSCEISTEYDANLAGSTCITACAGKKDGVYKSCENCTLYIGCEDEEDTSEHCNTDVKFRGSDINSGEL